MATYYEEAAKEFDFNCDLETEDIPLVVNQGGKRTLLVLKLDIEAKIKAYLESSGILKRLDDLEKAVDDLEEVVDDLEKEVSDLHNKIEELEENGVGSGGSLDEDGNPRTSTITVKGYADMTVEWTNSSGAAESFVLGTSAEEIITVTDLGTYEFKGIFATESKTVNLEVKFYDQEYEVEIYIYDIIKLVDCSWATVKGYADDGTAKYRFEVGDTKDINTAEGIRTIAIMDFENKYIATYDDGSACAIIFGATQLGYSTYTRTSYVATEDQFATEIATLYNGFDTDLKSVIPFCTINKVSDKVFAFKADHIQGSAVYCCKYYHSSGLNTPLLKRTNNGSGVAAGYWTSDGGDAGYYVGKYYYYIDSTGSKKQTATSMYPPTNEFYEIFCFCL